MAGAADDLDLLLSLDEDGGEAVLETPPSPHPADGAIAPSADRARGGTDMSVFREAVKDYLEATPASTTSPVPKPPKSTQIIVDSYSGLRIKNLTVSPLAITNRFADIRFVRISAIKNLAGSDSFSGCWATAGLVLDKGVTRVAAQGMDYSIWKMGALDESEVSVFLFAHAHYSGFPAGEMERTVSFLFRSAGVYAILG